MATPRLIMQLDVEDIRAEPGDVRIITFRHPVKPRLPAYQPGAHIDLHLPSGLVRQYSLLGDHKDHSRYVVGVKREANGRGGSAWLHENLGVGDRLPVSAPRSHFALAEGERHLLLAGGIGITPILSMARSLSDSGKPFTLHYFARSRSVTPLLAEIGQALGPASVSLHFDDEPDTRIDLGALLAKRAAGEQLYYCGPPGFMAAVERFSSDWPEDVVNFEAFAAPPDETFVPEPFVIRLASSGAELQVLAEETALSVLRAAGVSLASSCENGACGSCECGYVGGTPLHRDGVLKPRARANRFIPCVSRAKGTLTLDL